LDPDSLSGAKRRISRTITGTRAEATTQLQRLLVDTGCDLHGGTNATVAELLEQFMLTATLAPTTRQDWECVIARHLFPALGDRVLWRLTARDCDGLYAAMLTKGVGPSRVAYTHVVLHRAVAQAVRWGWIPHNPVAAAPRPVVPRVIITPPSAADVRRLLQLAEQTDPVSSPPRNDPCLTEWSGALRGRSQLATARAIRSFAHSIASSTLAMTSSPSAASAWIVSQPS
jgi:hypothetical protein